METASTYRASWPRERLVALAGAGLLVAGSLLAAVQLNASLHLRPASFEYNVGAWELRHFANRWLYAAGDAFRDAPGDQDRNVALLRFFALTDEIDALEREVSDTQLRELGGNDARVERLAAAQKERDRLENQVEATIEARISSAARSEGLTRSPLLLPAIVWPPVDFEFTRAPHTLAISPRERIELKETALLREDLGLAELEAIEAERGAEDHVSALAFQAAGVAAYPTIVNYTSGYRQLLELVAHEWTHTYLFFSPLGFNYYDSYDLRSMNETVADLVGRELASRVIHRWPLDDNETPRGEQSQPSLAIDVAAELRQLRGEVDSLLAAGAIDQAENLMEQRRRELVDQGARIRKINQAFFAFTNLYAGEAGNPAATNPIGPKIDELRRRSASLSAFVRVVSGITSLSELDRALAALD